MSADLLPLQVLANIAKQSKGLTPLVNMGHILVQQSVVGDDGVLTKGTVHPELFVEIEETDLFRAGLMETPEERTVKHPQVRLYRPTEHIPDPGVLVAETGIPFKLVQEKPAKSLLKLHGPVGLLRDHHDHGLRRWTEDLHTKEIVPALKKAARKAKKEAPAA